jgi:hypothetical protein
MILGRGSVKPPSLLAGVLLCGAAAGVVARPALAGRNAEFVPANVSSAPLSGIVRAGGVPLGGATVLVRAVIAGIASPVRILKTEPDGTWVVPSAARGLYTVMTLVPGFRPAIARVLHGATADALSFVRLDLEKPASVLPPSALGAADPWIARAVSPGDVLRDVPTLLAALDSPEPVSEAPPLRDVQPRALTLPVRASLASSTGFGGAGGGNLSRTTLDVKGSAGDSLRWGFGGQYSRLTPVEGSRPGDSSQISLDLAAGATQSFHASTRRQNLPSEDADPSRFATHSLDWAGATGDRSNASVSARVISESRVFRSGPAADLFARDSSTVDVNARYRTEIDDNHYVRVGAAYRTASMDNVGGSVALAGDHETRVGAVAGMRAFDLVVLEGGATGDFSARSHGVTPEMTLAFETKDGWRLYGFASRRFESRQDGLGAEELALAGTDEADLTRLSRGLYRAGLRWDSRTGESFMVEASRRDLSGTYRLLFDPDFLDRLDSLYFFPGDSATELSSSGTWHLAAGLDGRVAARVGRVVGERPGPVDRDDARYAVAEGAIRVGPTRTSFGVGYRVVSQSLMRAGALLHNDLSAVDFSVAQVLPVPALLRFMDSEWRALFSVEVGHRREGLEDEEKSNRRFAGGLAFSF